jgi:CHAD domain-containing protein
MMEDQLAASSADSEETQVPSLASQSSSVSPNTPVEETDVVEMPQPSLQIPHVYTLALTLFDQTLQLHELGEDSRRILGQAALMQGLPLPHGHKKTYRAVLQFVQARVSGLFTSEECNTLAVILANQKGWLKRKDLKALGLSPLQLSQALTVAALLEIATGIDHSASGQTAIREFVLAPEGGMIILEGPFAAADAQVAQHKAHRWARLGYPEIRVMEVADAEIWQQPFPRPSRRVGVLPDDLLAEAGRKVMCFHFAQMLRWEDGTRLGEDIEDLHRMRVATRRLRAAFEVFGDAFEPGVLKPHLKGLRATGRCLGKVRDLDVFLEKAQHYLESLPEDRREGLMPLLAGWQEQRQAARVEMLAFMDSSEYAVFKRKFNIFLNTPGAGARRVPPGQPLPLRARELVPISVYTRFAAVRAYKPFLNDAPVELLHALRIEFKKLRYTLEYFEEVLGKRAGLVIEKVKFMQDHLGDLNDAQVATHMLRDFIDDWELRQAELPVHERHSIEEVVNYLAYCHAERHHLMLAFAEVWKRHFENAVFRRSLASAVAIL